MIEHYEKRFRQGTMKVANEATRSILKVALFGIETATRAHEIALETRSFVQQFVPEIAINSAKEIIGTAINTFWNKNFPKQRDD